MTEKLRLPIDFYTCESSKALGSLSIAKATGLLGSARLAKPYNTLDINAT